MADSLSKALEKLADLLDDHAGREVDLGPGEDNFRCTQCEGCFECRFCVGCRSCERCTYCEGCESCVDCTQCRDSFDLEACSHCDHTRACKNSRYLTLCFDCEDCTQCFACVGLQGQEFCILNQHYAKSDYFKIVKELRAQLETAAEAGFLPAFEDDPEMWFDALESAGEPDEEQEVTAPLHVPHTPRHSGSASVTMGRLPPRPAAGSGGEEADERVRRKRSFLRAGRRPDRS